MNSALTLPRLAPALAVAVFVAGLAWLAEFTASPLLLASLGASGLVLALTPESPAAQPRSIVGGHLLGSALGLLVLHAVGRTPLTLGLAVGLTVAAMLLTRTLHAPAVANPVVVFAAQPGWGFLLLPTLSGAVLLVVAGLAYHRAVTHRAYPTSLPILVPTNNNKTKQEIIP